MDFPSFDLLIPGVCGIWLVWMVQNRYFRKGLPHPPGPKGLPIIGNVFDMPSSFEWIKAMEWRKTYGDLVYVKILGRPIVFLNSYQAAVDLLERKSAKYSSRPGFTMLVDMQKWDWPTFMIPYNDFWRKHTTHLHRLLDPSAVTKYHNTQIQQCHLMLGDYLKAPDDFPRHIRNFVGSSIIMIAYGHETEGKNDKYIALAEEGTKAIVESSMPGACIVDAFPFLRYLPEWFPGTSFHSVAKKGAKISEETRTKPYEMTKLQMEMGSIHHSMISQLIQENTNDDGSIKDEDVIATIAGSIFLAGADTSVSALLTFMLAMALHPAAQRRAQEEIDRVVGNDRIPSFEDRPNLPYLAAIADECQRWQPVTPLGVAHYTTQNDEYKGYSFPEGTTVLPNQWCMMHDEVEYPDPYAFKPERFLPEEGKKMPRDPKKVAFGFGRRLCPGKHVALNAIYLAESSILALFDIGTPTTADGQPIDVSKHYKPGAAIYPLPFKCSITPRSSKAEALIRHLEEFS